VTQHDRPASPVPAMTPAQIWAAYEQLVVETATAWHDYEVLACKADAALDTWRERNGRRNAMYDAYWAIHDRAA
jgi:hypothetical protein